MAVEFGCSNPSLWREALSSYESRVESLNKPNLVSLDDYYRNHLPPLLRHRNPNPFITTSELSQLMRWKLSRGKWRPRLLDFVSALDEDLLKSASQKALKSLPDISKAISELTALKGVGPATAPAILAAYAPDVAPFMLWRQPLATQKIIRQSSICCLPISYRLKQRPLNIKWTIIGRS